MNIVRDEIVLPQREEGKAADAKISKPPPFAASQCSMESSHNINNMANAPYQSYRKPLKRNNPIGASAPFPKIPPFAATNRPSGPLDRPTVPSKYNSSSNSGAPMSKKSKEDESSPSEGTKRAADVSKDSDVCCERDKSRVPSGLGRAVFKKPFDCKMVLKQRSPSKILSQPPPAVIEGLNKTRSDVESKSQNQEESLSDWINPRLNKNEVSDSGRPLTDFRTGADAINMNDPPVIPGLSRGNTSVDHPREPWKTSDLGSAKGSSDGNRFGSDTRSGGSFKGRDPARGTRWSDNDDSSRNDDRKKTSAGWLDGGGAAYAKQFEGKPGFGPTRGRGNMRDQENQNHQGNARHHTSSGSYNDFNHRNQQNSHQNWRQKDRHEENNRNWKPHGDKWNNDRGDPDGGNPNWRHSSRNQSAWTASSGPSGTFDNNDRFNRPPQNERFAQFEQKWNTGRTQGANYQNDSFIQRHGPPPDQNFNPYKYNSNYADSDDGKEIIVGQHMSFKDREPFQKDISANLSNQQKMPPFNNPVPHGNTPFNNFSQQIPPPNFPSPSNFLTSSSNTGMNNFTSQTPFNPPVSVGAVNTSAGQSFPNANLNYNSQPRSMSIPGVPVSSTQPYNWPSNNPVSNVNPGSIVSTSASFNSNEIIPSASNSASVSNFYLDYQSSNVSMPSTVVTTSAAANMPMTGQVPASQASNYTTEQLQDYQKQWDDYKIKWEKYQQELAEYNKKMQEVNATSAVTSQTPQQSFSVPTSIPGASVAPSPVVQQATALQQMTPALAVPNLGATGQLNLQAAAAAAVLQPNLTPNLGSNLLLNQPAPATATANPYQQAAAAQAMMSTMQQPTAANAAFNYAQFYPNANQTTATLQQAAGLMSMTTPTYHGAVNFAAAQIPSFYPGAAASASGVAAATNPLGILNPIAAAPAGTGAPI